MFLNRLPNWFVGLYSVHQKDVRILIIPDVHPEHPKSKLPAVFGDNSTSHYRGEISRQKHPDNFFPISSPYLTISSFDRSVGRSFGKVKYYHVFFRVENARNSPVGGSDSGFAEFTLYRNNCERITGNPLFRSSFFWLVCVDFKRPRFFRNFGKERDSDKIAFFIVLKKFKCLETIQFDLIDRYNVEVNLATLSQGKRRFGFPFFLFPDQQFFSKSVSLSGQASGFRSACEEADPLNLSPLRERPKPFLG